jgi:class 3 adenylate cyclase
MADLPAGTVTFLFTDVEGSTRLLERFPLAQPVALKQLDALFRAVIEDNHGYVFNRLGDGYFVVFARAADAVAAALEAQLAFRSADWGEVGQVTVRMGLHTGEAEHQDWDYVGPPLYRCARLMSTAYGEQVVLSSTTASLVAEALPQGASLRSLGQHALRDLDRADEIFQLVHPALPAEFPPLKSLDVPHHNLPAQLTSFVGRDEEIGAVARLL